MGGGRSGRGIGMGAGGSVIGGGRDGSGGGTGGVPGGGCGVGPWTFMPTLLSVQLVASEDRSAGVKHRANLNIRRALP